MLHIINADMAMEQPRPLPPYVKLVGPIMPRPAAALPPDLQVILVIKQSLVTPSSHEMSLQASQHQH